MFKVGDKVRICNPSNVKHGDVIGVVVEYRGTSKRIGVKWDTDKCVLCGDDNCSMLVTEWSYWPEDIKLVPTKNQQLLFSFME